MVDVKDVLKQLTDEQVIEVMLEIGFNYPITSSKKGEMIFTSLCHEGGDSKQKLYCYSNEETHRFNCYICLFNGNLCDLIMHIKECSFQEAFNVIKKTCNIRVVAEEKRSFGTTPLLSEDYWKLLDSYKTHKRPQPKLTHYDKAVLGLFTEEYCLSWIEDHISIEAMQKYGIGFYQPQNAITIPHRDIEGNLIGIRKRNLDEEVVARGFKYMPIKIQQVEYTHPLAFNLFSIYENVDTIKKIKKICLFESEKSTLQVESYYPNNNWSLAMCGSNLSNTQRDLIVSLGVEEVILCIDKDWEDKFDPKYKLFQKKYMTMAQKLAPYVNFYVVEKGMETELGLKESPSDRGKEVFERLLKQKKIITLEMVQNYFESDSN